MDAVRERLRGFYAESFAKMLKVRKTNANRILSMTQGDETLTIAKFNAEVYPDLADQLMDQCKARVIEVMVDKEMAKLTEGGSEAPGVPLDDLSKSIMPELDI